MMNRIKITNKQKEVLVKFELNESKDFDVIIKKVVDDLNLNYEPNVGSYRYGGEYFEEPVVKIKADGEIITPKDLLDYLKYKNEKLNEGLLKQIILDWVNGDLKNYSLTKNVKLR